ncbi:organic cation/carnitine transporter 3 [Prunus dulcis]|uniref:Organic cation/carnitine transporter 3 n=1 Tax=Prunus dulcis TaxID=3755 RepID=A0A4Y1RND5_PRUDU|nr:organic cation/carnitine transporter 3 [Prunus dulcis]
MRFIGRPKAICVEILGNVQFIGRLCRNFGRKSRSLVSGPGIGDVRISKGVVSGFGKIRGGPPAAAAVGTGAKRTGSASASRPSPPPRSAAAPAAGKRRFSPECRPNFAAADLPPPAAILAIKVWKFILSACSS